MEFVSEYYPTKSEFKEIEEANKEYIEITKELHSIFPEILKPSYIIFGRDFHEKAYEISEIYKSKQFDKKAEDKSLTKSDLMEFENFYSFFKKSGRLFELEEKFKDNRNVFETDDIHNKLKLSKHENIMDLLKDERFNDYFPPKADYELPIPKNPITAFIKAHANALIAEAVELQLRKEDPEASQRNPLEIERPLYNILYYIKKTEYAKLEYMLTDEILKQLKIAPNEKGLTALRDELLKIDSSDERFGHLLDKSMELLSKHFSEIPKLLQYGVLLYRLSEDPELKEYNEKLSKAFCGALSAISIGSAISKNPKVAKMIPKQALNKIPGSIEESFDVLKKTQNVMERIQAVPKGFPDLKLKEPVQFFHQLSALEPIPTIPMIVEAAIFAHYICNYSF